MYLQLTRAVVLDSSMTTCVPRRRDGRRWQGRVFLLVMEACGGLKQTKNQDTDEPHHHCLSHTSRIDNDKLDGIIVAVRSSNSSSNSTAAAGAESVCKTVDCTHPFKRSCNSRFHLYIQYIDYISTTRIRFSCIGLSCLNGRNKITEIIGTIHCCFPSFYRQLLFDFFCRIFSSSSVFSL